MKKISFLALNGARLSHDDIASLFQLTLDVANPVKDKIGDMAQVALANFAASASPFIDQINRLRESPLTIRITNLRTDDNAIVEEIKRIIVFEKKSRSEARKEAATDLEFFFKPYWDLDDRALGAHIKGATELSGKYLADAAIVAKATTIGVNVPMEELNVNNTSLASLYLARNEAVGGRGASGTDLRPAANDGYVQFCNVIEQSVNLMPNDTLITLFNNMDALRVKAHTLISKGKDKPEDTSATA